MKYIPLESFDAINSLLQGVEALGCLVTIRLEAYTCRHTREEKQIANNLAQYFTTVQSTPPLSPSPLVVGPAAGLGGGAAGEAPSLFPGGVELPPPMVLGSAVSPGELSPGAPSSSSVGAAPPGSELGGWPEGANASGSHHPYGASSAPMTSINTPVVTAQDIDERLVFMVAALNSMYEKDGYDFSVLTEQDFVAHTPQSLRDEVDLALNQLPEATCAPAVRHFWPAVYEQVGEDAAQGCEVFEFNCPACDPRADVNVFSKQYFLYNKSRKILVSLLVFGEGNEYRGDDGYAENNRLQYASSPEPYDEDENEEEADYGGKNRDFYGY